MGEYEETLIFLIYVIKRREIPRDTLGLWKDKGKCNPKVTLELYICTFSFERGVGTCVLMLLVDQLMRADYSPHSL